jgi:hypothetical protein
MSYVIIGILEAFDLETQHLVILLLTTCKEEKELVST